MDIFQHLISTLDAEGRYYLLNAIANQLRYPNNHTHYFSCVLLYLFAEANSEFIQEQITRVTRLSERKLHEQGTYAVVPFAGIARAADRAPSTSLGTANHFHRAY